MSEWLLALDGLDILIGLFLLLLGGAVGLPIPEDLPLLLGGIVIHLGKSPVEQVFAVCYAAIIIGDVLIYGIGRWLGPSLFRRRMFMNPRARLRLKRIRIGMERRSLPMIFVARHLFYLRTLTFLSCGALRMKFKVFLLADALAALISVPLMLSIGFAAWEHLDTVTAWIQRAKTATLLLSVLILVAGVCVYRHYRRREEEEARLLERDLTDETVAP